MAVYDVSGNELSLSDSKSRFQNCIQYNYDRDETTGAFYTHVIIPQKNSFGDVQFPFVYWPNYPNGGTESAYQLNQREKYLFVVNGGKYKSPWGDGVTLTGTPKGTVIQNGVVLQQGSDDNVDKPSQEWVLTINNKGELGYGRYYDSASEMVSNGIVSAVTGFMPIITNYLDIQDVETTDLEYLDNTEDAQRQVIGQYGNGDYAIITTEGRGYQGGSWFRPRQIQTLCRQLGLKFAFMLDGGGSVETVMDDKQFNPFYDNTYGRRNPTFIVFNGSTDFPA